MTFAFYLLDIHPFSIHGNLKLEAYYKLSIFLLDYDWYVYDAEKEIKL